MALNVAVSTAMELFDDNDLVFPVSMGRENLKILVSPGSESSGVSSLDAEEAKKMTADQLTSSSPIEPTDSDLVQTKAADSTDETDDSGVDEQDPITSSDENESNEKDEDDAVAPIAKPSAECDDTTVIADAQPEAPTTPIVDDTSDIDDEIRYKNLKVMYDGRDILDFCGNIANRSWFIQYTHLPEKNISMCLTHISVYNRLSANWDAKSESKMDTCRQCSFRYPIKNQCVPTAKTTALDAIDSTGLNDNHNLIINGSGNNHAPTTYMGGPQPKLSNPYTNVAAAIANNNNNGMNNPNINFNNNNNNNNSNNNGYQSFYPNQYSNSTTMNNNATLSASKQANYGFQYGGNVNTNINGFMNNFNQIINNSANGSNNNQLNNNNNKYPYAAYRQNVNSTNNASNNNNYGKMPYKMYSHFY